MATQTKTDSTPTIDAAFEQAREFNEQLLESARKAGNQYLDSYEKAVDRAIDLERKLAGASKQEWLKTMIDAHVDLTRGLTETYTAAARGLLK